MAKSRVARVLRLAALGVGGTIAFAVLAASVILQGPRLGHLIEGALPPNAGKMEIGGVEWHLRALVDLVTDAPSPISVDGLRIIDPEGTVVLDVPHLDARVKLRTLIGGSFSISDLRVPRAVWRFAAMEKTEGIGFLAALAPKVPPKEVYTGPGSFFEITSSELGDLDAIFDFPGAWGLELRHAHANASLIQSTVDRKHPVFGFDAGPVVATGGGYLKIMDDNVLPFDRVVINRVSTTPDRPDDIFLDLGEGIEGKSKLVAKGYFTGIYGPTDVPGIDLRASFTHAGDAFAAVAAGRKIEGLTVGDGAGDDGASASIYLHDTFEKLKVEAAFHNLDVGFQGNRALGVGFDLGFDAGAGAVDVEHFAFAAPGGGRLALDAHLDTTKLALDASVRLDDFHTESYVPPPVRSLAAGTISGRIDASADLAHQAARIRRVDLRLARAHGGGLPRVIRVHGDAVVSPEVVRTSGLTVAVTGASATAKGRLALEKQLVEAGVEVVADDLARLLSELGLPPLAKSAHLSANAKGSLMNPDASGDAVVRGVDAGGRALPELRAKFGLADGVARLDDLSGAAFGGEIRAKGRARLWKKRADKPLRSPEIELSFDARDLDLSALLGSQDVTGRVSLTADAEGPLDALAVHAEIPAGTKIGALGQSLTVGPVEVALAGDDLEVRRLRVTDAGGTVDVKGHLGVKHKDLDLFVTIAALPLAGLPGVADAGVPVEGTLSARLHVGGRPDEPELAGTIDLADVVVRGTALGPAHLTLAPTKVGPRGAPGVSVVGELFSRFHVDAEGALIAGGPLAHGVVTFNRVALEPLVPELAAFGDGRGVASGRVEINLAPGKPLALDVLLSELWLSVARGTDGAAGETIVQRVRVETASPLHVTVAGDHVVLDKVAFATDGGKLETEGRLDGDAIKGSMTGHLDLELVLPFLRSRVQSLHGDLDLHLTAGGTLSKPDLRGEIAIAHPIVIRPREFPGDVTIGSGTFALDTSGVAVKDLAVTVEGSTLRLSGGATLGPGFAPENLNADLSGDVAAKLLAFVAPDVVTDAHGAAGIHGTLRGTLAQPQVTGRLDLGAIDFRMRDLGTEVQIKSGVVELSNSGAVLHDVKVVLDEQGTLLIGASGVRPGRVAFTSLVPFVPGDVDVPLHGERLVYRSPGTFEVDDLAFDLDLKGNVEDDFALGGEVRLVSGRYLQDFKVQSLVISPRVNESAARPFYEGRPLLENLDLDLSVRTVGEGFVVQNNLAPEIHVTIFLHVGGTLSEPAIAGDVRPTDGRFNLPGMRGDFDLVQDASHITFVDTKSIADGETPELDVQAQSTVTDANGTDHNVRMRIHGPLRESQVDLSTDDGLDRTQTAVLLLTGRTTTDAQRFGTSNPTVGANISTGADVAGQLTRDTLANLMEPYIDDTFFQLTGLNLRLTVGPDGFQGRIRKRISRELNFQTDYLQGFQNNSHWKTQLDLTGFDYFGLSGGVERVTLSSQQGVSETLPVNWSAELRLDYPIRR
ncbi:MAG TPA: translocation/assembly module TamB domain-containing protein [Polyangia bacterium]|nr:translocation/assembly module TamB domain-containing protein [Polyangia bacterium]